MQERHPRQETTPTPTTAFAEPAAGAQARVVLIDRDTGATAAPAAPVGHAEADARLTRFAPLILPRHVAHFWRPGDGGRLPQT